MNKYLKLVFAVILLIVTIDWIGKSFDKIYFLSISDTQKTKGKVTCAEKNISMEGGVSFEYCIVFNTKKGLISFKQLFSPDSLSVGVGDSVIVKYSKKNYNVATLKINDNFSFEIGIALFLVTFTIILIVSSFIDLKK